jgi:REP element-mobilizing transposase RayT
MKKETFEAQKAFAGEKKASMLRRCVGHDYTNRQMYMITMVTEGRRPLFGRVVGRSDAVSGSSEAPHMELSPLGQRVADEWWATTMHHPEVEVLALQMMPDHLHGILFVREKMEQPLGMALRGFKQSCNRHFRELILGVPPVPYVALPTQQTEPRVALPTQQTEPRVALPTQQPAPRNRRGEDRTHGLLFARGYNDRLLLRSGQLATWFNYLAENPRRLLMKREHPDLFRVRRGVLFAGQTFSALGNLFLLQRPLRLQVQCSRRLTDAEIEAKVCQCLDAAAKGAVLVSPSISKGERSVMRAAFDKGFPLIYLQENGFSDLAKPGGARMEACARGQLLILAPWEHHNERITISRNQCLSLNEMARVLCESSSETLLR